MDDILSTIYIFGFSKLRFRYLKRKMISSTPADNVFGGHPRVKPSSSDRESASLVTSPCPGISRKSSTGRGSS